MAEKIIVKPVTMWEWECPNCKNTWVEQHNPLDHDEWYCEECESFFKHDRYKLKGSK